MPANSLAGVVTSTPIEDSVPQEQMLHKANKPPKKTTKAKTTTKARKVKVPLKQSERTDEFLLH
jgi:hypothetical protein